MSIFDPFQHFGFLTNRVSRLLKQVLEKRLRERGYKFPISCIGIMADLWSHDGVTQKELGMSLIKNKSSITKMLKALEDEGLIVKKDHPQDKRNKLIFLTSKGSKLQDFVEKSGKTIEKLLMVDVPEDNIEIAKEVLKDFYLLLSSKSTIQNQNHEKNYS